MKLRELLLTASLAAVVLLAVPVAHAGSESGTEGNGKTNVTVLPGKGQKEAVPIALADLKLKVGGREAKVLGWEPISGPGHKLEVVILIDDGANTSLFGQLGDLAKFMKELPEGALATVAYMRNGRALLAAPLTADHAAAARGLHPPTGGSASVSASPYFCLSDLANKWPSKDPEARREVVMITNGIDYYSPEYDPSDPYVQASIADALRANVAVYAIYWRSRSDFDPSGATANNGQSLLGIVASATGGSNYGLGNRDSLSIQFYLNDILLRLGHQYGLSYSAEQKAGTGVQAIKLQVPKTANKLTVAEQSWVLR